MKTRAAHAAAVVLIVLLYASTARADDVVSDVAKVLARPTWEQKDEAQDPPRIDPDPWTSRPRTVSLQGGTGGGPLGHAGLSFEYAPTRWFAAGAGGGGTPAGPVGALLPRLRFPITRWLAPGIGFPFSVGPYEYVEQSQEQCQLAGCSAGFRTTRFWPIAFWGHIEPNVEIRFPNGIAMRLSVGYSSIANGRDDRCTSTLAGGCPSSLGETRWYGGLALGYAF